MSNNTGKKRDTVITDGSGQEKDIAPVKSDYGSKWGNTGTAASGNTKTSYGSSWLGKAISTIGGLIANGISNYTGKNGGSTNDSGSELVKTSYAAGGTEPEKVEDGGGAPTVTGEGISSGGEGSGNGDTGGSNYTGTNTTYEPSIEQKRQSAYTEAEKERQRAIVDAYNAYETNKSSYGANAEALGNMGLTGSGYSDYMNSSAYATARGEVQQANAQSAYTKRLADETAAQEQSAFESARTDKINAIVSNIGEYDDEQLNALITENGFTEPQAALLRSAKHADNYNKVLNGVRDGTYTLNQAESFITQYGFDETEANAIRKAASDYTAAKTSGENVDTASPEYQLSYGSFVNSAYNATSTTEIEQNSKSMGITEDDKDSVISNVQNNKVTSILNEIKTNPNSISTAVWDNDLEKNLIPSDKIEQIAAEYSKTLVADERAFLDDVDATRYANENEARALLNERLQNRWIDAATKQKYQETFNKIYGYELKKSTDYKIRGLTSYNSGGNNFEVKVGNNSVWDVQTKSVDNFIKNVLVDKGTNGFYMLDGRVYLKSGGNVVEVVARNTDDSKTEFDALKKWLNGQVYN